MMNCARVFWSRSVGHIHSAHNVFGLSNRVFVGNFIVSPEFVANRLFLFFRCANHSFPHCCCAIHFRLVVPKWYALFGSYLYAWHLILVIIRWLCLLFLLLFKFWHAPIDLGALCRASTAHGHVWTWICVNLIALLEINATYKRAKKASNNNNNKQPTQTTTKNKTSQR